MVADVAPLLDDADLVAVAVARRREPDHLPAVREQELAELRPRHVAAQPQRHEAVAVVHERRARPGGVRARVAALVVGGLALVLVEHAPVLRLLQRQAAHERDVPVDGDVRVTADDVEDARPARRRGEVGGRRGRGRHRPETERDGGE